MVSTQRGLTGAIEVARERNLDEERARGLDVPSGQGACDRQRAPSPDRAERREPLTEIAYSARAGAPLRLRWTHSEVEECEVGSNVRIADSRRTHLTGC